MEKKLLLIEDDAGIRETITDYFMSVAPGEFSITEADDGRKGLELIEEGEWDIVLLDIMLPGIDGFSLCRSLRRKSDAPLIFISARSREEDVIYGYDLGCDDYIIKPFSIATLLAKVRAVLRRADQGMKHTVLTCGSISLDLAACRVFTADGEVELPPKEYQILLYLLKNKGTVCLRETLLVKIWGYEFEGDERILDNHMKKLRKSLGSSGRQIKTVIARGYRLTED